MRGRGQELESSSVNRRREGVGAGRPMDLRQRRNSRGKATAALTADDAQAAEVGQQ